MIAVSVSENEFKDYLRENRYTKEEAENFTSLFFAYSNEKGGEVFSSLRDITLLYGVEKLEDGKFEQQELLKNDKYRLYDQEYEKLFINQ